MFGLALKNNPLIIDGFARNGLRCVCPDIFEGDARPVDADPATFDREAWHKKHNFKHTGGIARDVIQALKAQGVTRFGLTGYCYGARLVFDLAFEDIGQVAVVTHPSALDFADLDVCISCPHILALLIQWLAEVCGRVEGSSAYQQLRERSSLSGREASKGGRGSQGLRTGL